MKELDVTFNKTSIPEPVEEKFELPYHCEKLLASDGVLYFTANKLYYLYSNEFEKTFRHPWCIEVSEIASYGKFRLAGFQIILKDGKELRFDNAFMGTRKKLIAALDKRVPR